MRENGKHISDQDLLLAADNELPRASAAEVRLHLSRCEACTERMRRLEEVSADVIAAYRNSALADFTNVETARRGLLRRMAEWRADSRSELRHVMGLVSDFFGGNRRLVYNAAFAIAAILVIGLIFQQVWLTNSGGTIAQVQAAPLPRPNLTPGATRAVTGP